MCLFCAFVHAQRRACIPWDRGIPKVVNVLLVLRSQKWHRGSHPGYDQEEGQAVQCSVFSKADTCSIHTSCCKGLFKFYCLLDLAYVVKVRDGNELVFTSQTLYFFLGCIISLEFCKKVVFASDQFCGEFSFSPAE